MGGAEQAAFRIGTFGISCWGAQNEQKPRTVCRGFCSKAFYCYAMKSIISFFCEYLLTNIGGRKVIINRKERVILELKYFCFPYKSFNILAPLFAYYRFFFSAQSSINYNGSKSAILQINSLIITSVLFIVHFNELADI